jgi:hypothetical protein
MNAFAPSSIVVPGNPVKPSKKRLKTVSYEAGLRHAIGNSPLEAYSRETRALLSPEVSGGYAHGFVAAVNAAYNGHYPVVISPDMIWLLIAQGFAVHVREDAETLRDQLLSHEGKAKLEVRRDEFLRGFAGNDWEGVFSEFSEQIRIHIGPDTHDMIAPAFSTTGIVEKAAFEITLMDAMQEYFDYDTISICGIPQYILQGEIGDWERIYRQAEKLAKYNLDWWIQHLLPTLKEFISAKSGEPNPDFWAEFYGHPGCRGECMICGEDKFFGHIVNFFPYIPFKKPSPGSYMEKYINEKHSGMILTQRNTMLGKRIGPFPSKEKRLLSRNLNPSLRFRPEPNQFGVEGISPSTTPQGLSVAPFTWKYYSDRFSMKFIAGFVGASQDAKTMAIRPEIGWAVTEANS